MKLWGLKLDALGLWLFNANKSGNVSGFGSSEDWGLEDLLGLASRKLKFSGVEFKK